ncbi:UNVERIFIED_CONTAM: Denticleless protein [Sesamum angustifolium]|uniref:Denticleless protein n=1 Tax=Sesamum angustifolium TaxID=2727405 RepID=A0AAW2NNI1_9LAMI
METPKPRSFFQDLRLREVNGFRVRKRPYMGNDTRDFDPIGAVAVEHSGEPSPPMALSFCKTNKKAHILALTDEGGYVTLFNTRQKFLDLSSYQENAEKSKVSEWMAHANAIFDLCWIKMKTDWNDLLQDDELMLTASGDQSIKVWDTEQKKCIRALMGHTGSIKSISCHPTNQGGFIKRSLSCVASYSNTLRTQIPGAYFWVHFMLFQSSLCLAQEMGHLLFGTPGAPETPIRSFVYRKFPHSPVSCLQ